jgi:hypothetical protein
MPNEQTQDLAKPVTDDLIPVRVRVHLLATDLDSGLFAQAFASQESLDEEVKAFLEKHNLAEGEDDGKNLHAPDHSDLQVMLPESIARILDIDQGGQPGQIDLEAILTFAEQAAQHLLKTGFPMDMIDSRLDNAQRRAKAEDAAAPLPASEPPAARFKDVFAGFAEESVSALRGTPVDSPRPARRPR